jgi:uncharacterized protein
MVGLADLRTLSRAVVNGDAEVISRFLEQGGNPSLGERGYSLLHEAVYCKQKDIVKLLLDAGAAVNQEDQDGLTPLHFVFSYPVEQLPPMVVRGDYTEFTPGPHVSRDKAMKLEILSMLLDAGANVNPVKKESDITYGQQVSFKTPLMEAAGTGNIGAVQLLLQHDADVNASDYYHATPIIEASNNGHPDVVKALIEAGANIDVHQDSGDTPLMRAIYYTSTAIMDFEASLEKKSPKLDPAQIKKAIESINARYQQVVELLLDAKADLEAEDDRGQTALFACINEGNIMYLQKVLAANANVHHTDKSGNEPLNFLVKVLKNRKLNEAEMAELARMLIEAGANRESKDYSGLTPLAIANHEKFTLIASILQE